MSCLRGIALVCLVAASASGACRRPTAPKQYELSGQVLGIRPDALEMLVKHGDIPGFMPAMTMPYKVKDDALLQGKAPGDLITATVAVTDAQGVLTSITTTGHAAIDQPPAAETTAPLEVLTEGMPVPDEFLVDQDGTARALSSFKGHRVAMTFIYTSCPMPDFCPLMDRNFAALQGSLRKSPELADVRLLSVTIDPKLDKPPVLKAHARKLNADPKVWSFLTGDEEHLSRFAAQFGLAVVNNDKNPRDITHTLRTVVIDPQGILVKTHMGNSWTPSDLLADIKAVPPSAH